MSFGKAISAGFINYFNFSDRACRSEFWYWGLFCSVVSIALFFIDAALHNHLLLTVFMIATCFPTSPSRFGGCMISMHRAGGFC